MGRERVRIDTNGNVGIGTTAPEAKLHVQGNIKLQDYGLQQEGDYFILRNLNATDNWGLAYNRVSNDVSIGYNGKLIVKNNGNVGIGTGEPQARLHVIGAGQTSAIIATAGNSYYSDWPSDWGGGLATWDVVGAATYFSGLSYSF